MAKKVHLYLYLIFGFQETYVTIANTEIFNPLVPRARNSYSLRENEENEGICSQQDKTVASFEVVEQETGVGEQSWELGTCSLFWCASG